MIMVELSCSNPVCDATESIDVYHDQWTSGAAINRWLPEDWTVVGPSAFGYANAFCPEHSA